MRETIFVIFSFLMLGCLAFMVFKTKDKYITTMYVATLFALIAFYLFQFGNLQSFSFKALSTEANFINAKKTEVQQDAAEVQKIKNQLAEILIQSKQNIKQIKGDIQSSRNALRKVQDNAFFLDTVIAAQNDDRHAFDQLKKWADDRKFDKRASAGQAWLSIVEANSETANRGTTFISGPINKATNTTGRRGIRFTHATPVLIPEKASFYDLRSIYSKLTDRGAKIGFLQAVWFRNDFSARKRMAFMIDVMKTESSLRVMEEAAMLFQLYFIDSENKEWHLKKPLMVDVLFDWWERNRDTVSDKLEIDTHDGK